MIYKKQRKKISLNSFYYGRYMHVVYIYTYIRIYKPWVVLHKRERVFIIMSLWSLRKIMHLRSSWMEQWCYQQIFILDKTSIVLVIGYKFYVQYNWCSTMLYLHSKLYCLLNVYMTVVNLYNKFSIWEKYKHIFFYSYLLTILIHLPTRLNEEIRPLRKPDRCKIQWT